MREYRNANGLIVRSDVDLKWDGWQEVASATTKPVREKPEKKKKAHADAQAVEESAEDDDSDLDVMPEPVRKGEKK